MSLSFWSESVVDFLGGAAPAQISAWLGTYLVHGVLLFAVAAIAARWVKSARVTEQLWRAALFGPLVTASLQLGAGLQPALGHWELPGLEQAAPESTRLAGVISADQAAAPSELELREMALQSRIVQLNDSLLALVEGPSAPGETAAEPEDAASPALLSRGSLLALLALSLGIGALMLRAMLEAIRMHRLGRRKRLMSGPAVAILDELTAEAGLSRRVALETTAQGESPFATGVLFPRIVLPLRALRDLGPGPLRAMLAHEMGHVARFDPLWTAAARSVAALFFFQPLNWMLVRRLDEAAEFCCDEFAVDVTGNEVELARCLATVAEWIVGSDARVRAACPMAHKASPLAARVSRILATDGEPARPLGLLRGLGGAAVIATAIAAPGFAASAEPAAGAAAAPGTEASVTGVALVSDIAATPVPITVHVKAADAAVDPSATFTVLAASVRALQSEIRMLLEVAAERDVPAGTRERLAFLHERAEKIAVLCVSLQSKLDAASSSAR